MIPRDCNNPFLYSSFPHLSSLSHSLLDIRRVVVPHLNVPQIDGGLRVL